MRVRNNRRGFVRQCFGVGAGLAAIPHPSRCGATAHFTHSPVSAMEQALSATGSMDVLGNPRSWSLVSRGLHPFMPERTAILPPALRPDRGGFQYGDRCGRDLRRQIDEQIELEFGQMDGFRKKW